MELIGDLSESDLDGYNYLPVALKGLKDDLKAVQWALDFSQKKTVKAKAGRGAPRKLQAIKIARAVAEHYLGLTGKEAKRNNRNDNAKSPCQELLAAVYEILGVKANAEHCLRVVAKEKRQDRKNEPTVERNRKIGKDKAIIAT